MTTYDIIKSIAEEKNISIHRVEKDAGLGNATIVKWKSASPSVANLLKVATVLDVPLESLIGNEEPHM